MSQLGKELLSDCSTPRKFQFSLRCAECGRIWKSRPIRFSRADVLPLSDGKRVIFEALYKREKEAAWLRAAEEAEKEFNLCPICNRMVCDYCFLICDDIDLCSSCASHLQETGSPVAEQKENSSILLPE